MTSTPINGMADFSNFMKNPNATQGKSDMSIGKNFAKTMSKVSDDLVAGEASEPVKTNVTKVEAKGKNNDVTEQSTEDHKIERASDTTGNKASEETEKANADATVSNDNVAEQAEQIKEKAEELLKQVAEELDVSTEEIEKVMEVLGITLFGLLDGNQMSNLVLEVSGAEDMMALVTDENLYQSMTTLSEAVQTEMVQLQDALGLSEEDLKSMIAQIEEQTSLMDPESEMVEQNVTMDSESGLNLGEELLNPIENTAFVNDSESVDDKIAEPKDTKEYETSVDTIEETQKAEADGNVGGVKQSQNENSENDGNFANLMNQQVMQQATSNETVGETATMQEYTPEPQEIANQIMDYMRTQVKAEITQLEIQLHPASLGTININLQTREGNLTAQFTAQNELVRSVIESQIVQLQSQLEEQGIKVDAVEVAVSNHQFERNFHQEQGQGSGEQPKKRGARRIDLNALGDISDEELTEEEQLTVDMMARNGNSVDYTV